MEAAPPSYETATIINHWDIIARYVPTNELCSAALVCSRWHSTFTPHLWGNPASHFGVENDEVYVALTKFKRTLRFARLLVRRLTHTLHLPPAHAEIYNGPHADWLRDVLERLPNLQSLIVRGLPFFDHSALQALKYKKPKSTDVDSRESNIFELPGSSGLSFASPVEFIPSFGLRLLDASRCPNITPSSLAQALGRFEGLLYLDLSFTYPARDQLVLSKFRRFAGLQVLKLRGLSLTDEALKALAPAIKRRVRSLDIRNNQITDRGVRTLLDECFLINSQGSAGHSRRSRSPGLVPYMGSEMLDIYQSENFEGYLRNAFTGSFVGRQAFEDAPEGGITHLYIAQNKVSAEGAAGLLRSGRLHVLDLEDVTSTLGRYLSNSGYDDSSTSVGMPGVEKLAPLVAKFASETMTFLRIDHRLITKNVTTSTAEQEKAVEGPIELGDTERSPQYEGTFEIDSRPTLPDAAELPGETTPRYELPGDPLTFVLSTPSDDGPPSMDDHGGSEKEIRRGSVFAPEVVLKEEPTFTEVHDMSEVPPEMFDKLKAEEDRLAGSSPQSAAGEDTLTFDTISGSTIGATLIAPTMDSTSSSSGTSTLERPVPAPRLRRYSSVADERKGRLSRHIANNQNLHPAMLPHVKELVLTDVPPFGATTEVVDLLKVFIKQCGEEAGLAKKQAKVDYALPPGRRGHANAIKQSADKTFALKRIVLELASGKDRRRSSKSSPWQHVSTKSVTDDRDSESLWSAAETDFSFFGDEEDQSFPGLEPDRYSHSYASNEKETTFGRKSAPQQPAPPKPAPPPRYDTIALLSAFRKERKLAHQRQLDAGADDPETEGYWSGVISVIRPETGLRHDEELDYYGNLFQKGWLYP